MQHVSTDTHSTDAHPANAITSREPMSMNSARSSESDAFVKGVATAVVVSTIVQTGKSTLSVLSRQPLVMFGLGLGAGYLAHKYRKEIMSISSKTAEQGKDFLLRQKENIKDLLAESADEAEGKNMIE